MRNLDCHFYDLADGRMACWRDPATAGKPTLILGHGNGLSALCQIGLIKALGAHYDVHALDFRGHGASRLPTPDQPEDPWGTYVMDLEALIDKHFDGSVAYAGHSLGGVMALRLARQRPEMFSRLVAIDPAILPRGLALIYPWVREFSWANRRNRLYQGALRRRDTWADAREALAYFTGRKALSTWPDEAVEAYVASCLKPQGDGTLGLCCPRGWEARTFKYVPTEIARILRSVATPSLILRAERGSIYPKTLRLNPATTLKIVAGTHFAHLENPELIADHIHEFLRA